MNLDTLRLWNFRKYDCGTDQISEASPALEVQFNSGLNVLIGENDSGKTSIVDAIRHLLGTQSREWYRIETTDFSSRINVRASRIKIEAVFRNFSTEEAAPFLEWMGFEEIEGKKEFVLTVWLIAEVRGNRVATDIRAGTDNVGSQLDGYARELLRITYLKPLRDSGRELTPGRSSRLAQILSAYDLFTPNSKDDTADPHPLVAILNRANTEIENYFAVDKEGAGGSEILKTVNAYLSEFFPIDSAANAEIEISGGELGEILKRLSLVIGDDPSGLGTLNLLYISAELLLLQSEEYEGFRLGIIEELEAHLHPQAQLRLIESLQQHFDYSIGGQLFLTTHSPTLASSIDLNCLIICKEGNAFPMAPGFTELTQKNYDFLHRFLDATKANLFFARGVILVEGDAENLLVPTIAEIIGKPLYRYGVSIVNVGSTAFLHYAKIFQRKDDRDMQIPVAVITDMDVKPEEWEDEDGKSMTPDDIQKLKSDRLSWAHDTFDKEHTLAFLPDNWTLEYEICLDPSFSEIFYDAMLFSEKKENSVSGVPQEGKEVDVAKKVSKDIANWSESFRDDPRLHEKIAFEIYNNYMLKKSVSKAVTAQEFASKLKDIDGIKELLLQSKPLKYLIAAIEHVTQVD